MINPPRMTSLGTPGEQVPTAAAVQAKSLSRSDYAEGLAHEIVKAICPIIASKWTAPVTNNVEAEALANAMAAACERVWKWETTDTWPPV